MVVIHFIGRLEVCVFARIACGIAHFAHRSLLFLFCFQTFHRVTLGCQNGVEADRNE